ncbi:MAG: hypothetical protein IPK92_21035 [Nitrospira sp.]|nr:hypothetical protein [Nitrospira sp.]MBL8052793.1 hypothetical protein [Nitrospira sp.]
MASEKPRMVILCGGFDGMYTALEFERALDRGTNFVALNWTLDVLFSKNLVHFRTTRPLAPPPAEKESKNTPVWVSQRSLDTKAASEWRGG